MSTKLLLSTSVILGDLNSDFEERILLILLATEKLISEERQLNMDFFKVKKFRKAHKPVPEKDLEDKPVPESEEPKNDNAGDDLNKSANADPIAEAEDDDDDFITNEVKRRLKELRRNNFMVLIPEEESCAEEEEDEEEEGETSSSEWRDVEAEARQWWCGFDAVYDKYCDRMLFFDRMSRQQLNEVSKGSLLL